VFGNKDNKDKKFREEIENTNDQKTYKRYFVLDHKKEVMIMFGKCDHPTWRDAQSTHFNFSSYAFREKVKVTYVPYSEI